MIRFSERRLPRPGGDQQIPIPAALVTIGDSLVAASVSAFVRQSDSREIPVILTPGSAHFRTKIASACPSHYELVMRVASQFLNKLDFFADPAWR